MNKVATLLRIPAAGIALSIFACVAPATSSSGNPTADDLKTTGCTINQPDPRACDPADTKKTTICHIPPGNPGNAHTICVGNAAVQAHLDHGDFIGTCECSGADLDAGGGGADATCDGGSPGSNYGGGSTDAPLP
jgi:hypothetical protein